MSLEVKTTCPLGSQCEEIRGGHINRCAWYIKLEGHNPQTGERVNETGCAIGWIPILMVEGSRETKGTTAAVEALKNLVTGYQPQLPGI